MARRLRLHVPGGFYHVTLRGNHRQPIFFRDEDRNLLDSIVADSIDRLGARVHAYCWMTNHLHLLVQVACQPLSGLMMRIASSYARRVQWRMDTTGHLFERRYHADLIDADRYLLAVLRYIHLNPVEAGLVAHPTAWPWSSHHDYLGLCRQSWITTHFALGMLAPQPGRAIELYNELMTGLSAEVVAPSTVMRRASHPPILGGDDFLARLPQALPQRTIGRSLEDLVCECCQRFELTPELLSSPSRNRRLASARAWLANEAVIGRVTSISGVARRLNRSESALRQLVKSHCGRNPPK